MRAIPTNTAVAIGVLLLAADKGHGVSGFSSTTNRKPLKVFTPTSLRVATIDAGELFDGSFFVGGAANDGALTDNVCLDSKHSCSIDNVVAEAGKATYVSASRAVEKISNSGLVWAAIGAFLSLSAAVHTHAIGSSMRVLNSVFSWYLTRLDLAPLLTKCVTGGIIALIGDYGAQWFEYKSSRRRQQLKSSTAADPAMSLRAGGASASKGQTRRLSIHGTYDLRRGLARFLECLLISSPLMHYGYDFFETVLPVVGSLAALAHVLADCIFLDAIFVGTSILVTGILEGHSLRKQVLPNLRNVYLPTLKASVVTSGALVPLQFMSFRFLPVQLRVLSVNAVDLIWTGVVSFVSHGGNADGEGGGQAHA